MKSLSRKRILSILYAALIWLLGVLAEDPIKRLFSLIKFNFSMNINPYILALTVLLVFFILGLILFWKIKDRVKMKRKYMEMLIEEVQKAQIANRYNFEVIKDINRILKEKFDRQAMLHGNFFPDVYIILKDFRFDSFYLLDDRLEKFKKVLGS